MAPEAEIDPRCVIHKGCGGVVAPNMGALSGPELLEMTLGMLDCGEVVAAGELELEALG